MPSTGKAKLQEQLHALKREPDSDEELSHAPHDTALRQSSSTSGDGFGGDDDEPSDLASADGIGGGGGGAGGAGAGGGGSMGPSFRSMSLASADISLLLGGEESLPEDEEDDDDAPPTGQFVYFKVCVRGRL